MKGQTEITRILLPEKLADEQSRLLVKYARLPRSLTREEWPLALTAFDLLHAGRVLVGSESLTFQMFYLRHIDALHATSFLEQLVRSDALEPEASQLAAKHWLEIEASLQAGGLSGTGTEDRALLTYCLYWWRSFCKGYVRELSIFRDLRQAGVAFDAHDLCVPSQRRSSCDLVVLGRRGDVKTSTYFLHTARAFPLRCDFYIVRLWHDTANRWLDIVLLKPVVWRELGGQAVRCTWRDVPRMLPAAAQVDVRGYSLVVASYPEWKMRVLAKQSSVGGATS